MQTVIIGTAGHVDHGKSALAWALTGTNPDRLPEEQARGMTIDLGFVFLPLTDRTEAAIIDVPGHERFLRTMIAGAHSIRMVLFVVAADEGIMPQAVEHLDVLKLLGTEKGVIVITKIDKVEKEYVEVVTEEVRDLVKGSFLENAPVFPVSCATNEGIAGLRDVVVELCRKIEPLPRDGVFRCPIDRIFTMKGFGTIVAGTVISGRLDKSETIEVLPTAQKTRIRNLQVHNQPVAEAFAGQRVAFNLKDIAPSEIGRGYELSVPDYLRPTLIVDARLSLLPTAGQPLKNNERVRLHKGTGEVMARINTLDKAEIPPGGEAYVQLRPEKPIVGERRERFILRSFSTMKVLGGGRLLELYPPRKAVRGCSERIGFLQRVEQAQGKELVETVILHARRPVGGERELTTLTNISETKVSALLRELLNEGAVLRLKDNSIIHRKLLEDLKSQCVASIERFITANPVKAVMDRSALAKSLRCAHASLFGRVLDALTSEGKVELKDDGVKVVGLESRPSPETQRALDGIERLVLRNGFRPLRLSSLLEDSTEKNPKKTEDLVSYLVRTDRLVAVAEGAYLHREMLNRAQSKLVEYLRERGTIRAVEYRDVLGVSGDVARTVLDYFFSHQVTVRDKGTHRLPDGEPIPSTGGGSSADGKRGGVSRPA